MRKQAIALRILLSCILLSFLPSVGGTARSEFYTKDEMIDSIYEFQNLINQQSDPSIDLFAHLFPYIEGSEFFAHDFYCLTGEVQCERWPFAEEYSYLLKYLRSKNGPIFSDTKGSKISIYIDAGFEVSPDKGPICIKALIETDDGIVKPARFYMMDLKASAADIGRITQIIINEKTIKEYIREDIDKLKGRQKAKTE